MKPKCHTPEGNGGGVTAKGAARVSLQRTEAAADDVDPRSFTLSFFDQFESFQSSVAFGPWRAVTQLGPETAMDVNCGPFTISLFSCPCSSLPSLVENCWVI